MTPEEQIIHLKNVIEHLKSEVKHLKGERDTLRTYIKEKMAKENFLKRLWRWLNGK